MAKMPSFKSLYIKLALMICHLDNNEGVFSSAYSHYLPTSQRAKNNQFLTEHIVNNINSLLVHHIL